MADILTLVLQAWLGKASRWMDGWMDGWMGHVEINGFIISHGLDIDTGCFIVHKVLFSCSLIRKIKK